MAEGESLFEKGPSLELLTDEAIEDFTTDQDGTPRILTDFRDANLKCEPLRPWKGGLYDLEIFGSPYVDRCLCGYLKSKSDYPCPHCNARVYGLDEGLRRFGRIEFPFYYLNDLRFELFKEVFYDIFSGVQIRFKFFNKDLRVGGYSKTASGKTLTIKTFDSCQFDYSPKKKELVISESITDESKCSYEGLIKIIDKHFPSRLAEFKKLINRLYIVQPALVRPFTLERKRGKKTLGASPISVWYSNLILLCSSRVDDNNTNTMGKVQSYNEVMKQLKTPGERVRYTAILRAFINWGKKEATELLNTSKENLSRTLYKIRTKNSARCPIIPSTTLKIDEVSVPRHIAYELCRSGFIKYLMDTCNFTRSEAKRSVEREYNNPEIQRLFKEYAEKQYVINVYNARVIYGVVLNSPMLQYRINC